MNHETQAREEVADDLLKRQFRPYNRAQPTYGGPVFTYGQAQRAVIAALTLAHDRALEEAAGVCLSELPKARWSCSDDESGTALTLARQRQWSHDKIAALKGQQP